MTKLETNDLVFAKVKPDAIIPTKEKENAGYDIYACFEEDYMIIPPHSTKLIPTGIAAAVSDNYYLQVHERGSTGSKGMKYGAGVIDSSYRGEIFICINNVNNYNILISKIDITESDNINEITYEDLGVPDNDELFYSNTIYIKKDKDCRVLYDNSNNQIFCVIYPYKKAIAQLIVHEVPVMNVKEITYEELKAIPSERGIGALGSSGK